MLTLWIAVAGALGTLLRYGTGLAAARWLGTALPWGTLLVNLVGSFALGLVAQALHRGSFAGLDATDARVVLGVGLMGGFTTYSSFNLETLRLLERAQLGLAFGYATGTFVGCLLAGLAGVALGRALAGGS